MHELRCGHLLLGGLDRLLELLHWYLRRCFRLNCVYGLCCRHLSGKLLLKDLIIIVIFMVSDVSSNCQFGF